MSKNEEWLSLSLILRGSRCFLPPPPSITCVHSIYFYCTESEISCLNFCHDESNRWGYIILDGDVFFGISELLQKDTGYVSA